MRERAGQSKKKSLMDRQLPQQEEQLEADVVRAKKPGNNEDEARDVGEKG
jgi:hypothetical protein